MLKERTHNLANISYVTGLTTVLSTIHFSSLTAKHICVTNGLSDDL